MGKGMGDMGTLVGKGVAEGGGKIMHGVENVGKGTVQGFESVGKGLFAGVHGSKQNAHAVPGGAVRKDAGGGEKGGKDPFARLESAGRGSNDKDTSFEAPESLEFLDGRDDGKWGGAVGVAREAENRTLTTLEEEVRRVGQCIRPQQALPPHSHPGVLGRMLPDVGTGNARLTESPRCLTQVLIASLVDSEELGPAVRAVYERGVEKSFAWALGR